jgi:hypothetical protein
MGASNWLNKNNWLALIKLQETSGVPLVLLVNLKNMVACHWLRHHAFKIYKRGFAEIQHR